MGGGQVVDPDTGLPIEIPPAALVPGEPMVDYSQINGPGVEVVIGQREQPRGSGNFVDSAHL